MAKVNLSGLIWFGAGVAHVIVALPAQVAPVSLSLRDFTLELRAEWERVTDTKYHFEREFPLVRDLAPAAASATYGRIAFEPLLPRDPVTVGSVWRIDVVSVLPLLRQFHPGATAELHHDHGLGFGALGGYACLRLLSDAHAEVFFRVHAEFVLEGDGGRGSSWFTPAQFRGRMVIDRVRGVVAAFSLAVPDQSANVDINIAQEDGVTCDIGRIPKMELASSPMPAFAPDATQISVEEAAALLTRKFYPLAEIDWLDLPTAHAVSVATGKPLHVVALFGSLLDESC